MPIEDRSKVARDRWTREDELINHRLQWLGVTQGLLFASYSLSFQLVSERKEALERSALLHKIDVLQITLPLAGIFISAFILLGVLAALLAMYYIRKDALAENVPKVNLPGVRWFTTMLGWSAAAAVPIIFVLAWILILEPQLAYNMGLIAKPVY